MKYILPILILFATNTVFAQKIYTRNDTISITQDSITIKAGSYRGNIQWQKSLDNKNWLNLEGKTTDSLRVKPDTEAIYRAKVVEGTCLPVFSDSVAIVTTDSITKNYVDLRKTDLILISDTTEISNGNYIYTGTTNTENLEVGKVIVDEQSGGTIRIITDIIQQDDTVSVKTDQATLEDLFLDASFKLSTKMVYPTQNLKSATLLEIEKALTDDDGFIHPVKVIYTSEEGAKLKSASILYSDRNVSEGGTLYMHKDWSGKKIYDVTGTFSFPNKKGVIASYSGNAKAYISEGYFTFDPEFKFEFEFDRPNIDWRKFKISKGEIKKFKFYSDRSKIDFKNILAYESSTSFEIGKKWTLAPSIINGKFEYLVSGVYMWIDVKIDLNCSLSAEFESGSIIRTGFQNTNYITIGAGYENKDWTTIKEIEHEIQLFNYNNGYNNSKVRFDIYPSVELKIYSIVGPYFNIGPYINYEVTQSHSANWNNTIDWGVDASVGVSVDVFGKEIASLNPFNWNLVVPKNLFSSPSKLSLESGDNQTVEINTALSNPIVVKVTNSLNQPVNGVQVHFFTSSGSAGQTAVKTDANGLAQTNWTLSANSGEQILKVYLLDGKDLEINDCSLTVHATATSTNLPTVTTNPITAITQTTATSGGNISSDGGASVTARGVCWSTYENPTIANSITTDGADIGSFTSNLTGLTANTKYYVRAYATNSTGIAYGEPLSFTTTAILVETGTVTDIDGNVYHTVTIGTQVWMVENLKTTKYRNGDPIPNVTDNTEWAGLTTGAYCNNDNDASMADTYGRLYNWYAINDNRNLAPTGWHVTSDAEWTTLTDFLGGEGVAGGKLKETGTTHWYSPNTGATNEKGFTALPGGNRMWDGAFNYIGGSSFWWSSSEYNTDLAWARDMGFSLSNVYRYNSYKEVGFSVRCVRD